MSAPQSNAKVDLPFRSDEEIRDLVLQFEACTWPYARWTHRSHLAVALSYLRLLPFDEALARVRAGIQRYNTSSGGDPNGYHETITVFFMRALAARLREAGPDAPLAELVNAVCESTAGKDSAREYYSSALMSSDDARTGWVEPDLKPLPF